MGQSASSILFEQPNPLANEELAIQQVTGGTLKDGIFLIEYADEEVERGIILFEVENLKPGVQYQTLDRKNSLRRQSRTEIKINEQVVRITKKTVPSNPQIEKELRALDSKIEENRQVQLPPPPILSDTEYKRKQVEDLEIQYKLKRENDEKQKLEKEKEQEKKNQEETERAKLQKEQDEKNRLERERLQKEQEEKDKLELERIQKEKEEKDRLERERLQKEQEEKDRLEKERLQKEQEDKNKLEKERLQKEQEEKDKLERERIQKEKR